MNQRENIQVGDWTIEPDGTMVHRSPAYDIEGARLTETNWTEELGQRPDLRPGILHGMPGPGDPDRNRKNQLRMTPGEITAAIVLGVIIIAAAVCFVVLIMFPEAIKRDRYDTTH